MKKYFILLFIIGCSSEEENENVADLTFENPQDIIRQMTRGINIGNTLEPPPCK